MKDIIKIWTLIGFAVLLSIFANVYVKADTGNEGAVRLENGAFISASQIGIPASATVIQTAATKVACLKIRNLSSVNRVWISSSANVSASNGFVLFQSTFGATSQIELGNYTGPIQGISENTSVNGSSVAVLTCNTNQP